MAKYKYIFSSTSKSRLRTCHPKLQEGFNEVIKHMDCSVLEGQRSEERQNELFKEGKTKVVFPNSKHNAKPYSKAVDVAPYPIDWDDRERQTLFAGFVLGMAKAMNINRRWGGDWDKDWETSDNRFDDFPHFELTDD